MKPLYILAKLNELEEIQKIDKKTLKWMYEKQDIKSIENYNFAIELNKISLTNLKPYFPIKKEYLIKEKIDSIHGIRHSLRVQIYILIICSLLEYTENISELLIAGRIHDTQRINDKSDLEHGIRAAKWLLEENKFNGYKIDLITNIIKYHNIEYDKIPNSILNKYKLEINIFKAADALDRFRLPKEKWWPNKKYLKLNLNYEVLFKFARKLIYDTEKLYLDGLTIKFTDIKNLLIKYNIIKNGSD